MALQSRTITVGADKDVNNGGKNYVSGQVIYIKDEAGVLAPIFRDIDGLDPIAQNTISNVTNAKGQFTFFIEEGNYTAEYNDQSIPLFVFGADYFNNQIDFVTNQILSNTQPYSAGNFTDGFTFTELNQYGNATVNDGGTDYATTFWYIGGTLPHTVAPLTNPRDFPLLYQQRDFNSAEFVATKTTESAQGFIDSFALKIFQSPTDGLTKIKTRTLLGGEVYEVRKVSDDSLATIYSDKEGLNPITQNGTSNVSGSGGVVEFFIFDGDYYIEVNTSSSDFRVSNTVITSTVNELSMGKFKVGTEISLSDRGYAKFKISSGGVANGYDILNAGAGNTAVLITGLVVDAAAFGVNGVSDGLNVQAIYNYISDCAVVNFGNLNVDADTLITLENKDNITTIGGAWHWNHQGSNMIKLAGTLKNPTFRLKEIYGNSDAFVSQGAIGCSSGVVTENWYVSVGKVRNLPFGVYINADVSGSHINPSVENTMFENMTRFANDGQSGAGLGLVFASDAINGGGAIVSGKSVGNTFKRCERHGLYVSNGGNVTSINDTFVEHREGMAGTMPIELAAAQISRSAYNFKMTNPTFINCNDLALAIGAVQTGGAQTFGSGVDITSPIFDGNKGVDIKINNDSPSVNGHIDNVKISGVTINQYGDNQNNRIQIFAGIGNRIKGVTINSDTARGVLELVDIIRIFDYATPSELDDLVIEDLKGSVFGASSRGVNVDNGILTGSHKVTLKDIFVGTTKIRQAVASINYNYRVFDNEVNLLNSAFTVQFNDATSVVNNQDKYFGKMLLTRSNDVVSSRPVFATGSSPTDDWIGSDGVVIYSPV